MISLSYSRISLADIAAKLQLDSPQDAEYIIAKAIRDGVIEASLDHEEGYMQSKVKLKTSLLSISLVIRTIDNRVHKRDTKHNNMTSRKRKFLLEIQMNILVMLAALVSTTKFHN